MSEPELTGVVDPDAPAADAPPVEAPPAEPPAVAAPLDDVTEEEPEGTLVPVSALRAWRKQAQDLKPLAEKAQQLEAYVNDVKPYVEFLKNNPQLLQRQEPAQPAAPVSTEPDPDLVDYARSLELYDATTGQPDVKRAAKIRERNKEDAKAIAQEMIAPVQATTHEARAAANLQSLLQVKDANGTPLDQRYIMEAVRPLTANLTKAEALRVLADPQVTGLIELTALGLQSKSKKASPAAPAGAPLHVESPGGGSQIVLSEDSRKLLRGTKITEKQYLETAKHFKPGQSNVLE